MGKLWRILAGILVGCLLTSSAFAVEILPKDEEYEQKVGVVEPIATPDPRAVLVGSEEANYVENGELEDTGKVELHWNGTAYSAYGCTTGGRISFTNPNRSNIGLTLSIAIFDGDLVEYFGTTFREAEEVQELAMAGYEALQNGIWLSNASYLVEEGEVFEGMNAEDIAVLNKSELAELLGEKNFLGMTAEEFEALDEAGVQALSEIEKLNLAKLGGYNFYTYYMSIAEAGVINPGYALYEIDLHTLPGLVCIPKGEYKAVFVLNAYDANKNELSDFYIHLPITLQIENDLPEDVLLENGITLATRIDG